MCGIIAIISKSENVPQHILDDILPLIKRRGPDATGTKSTIIGNGFYLHMISTVLHLQGNVATQQPYVTANGDFLQWNGDVFGGLEVKDGFCDTVILANCLSECANDAEICKVFSLLHGPYAFVFFQNSTKRLYFGRDYFGRHSLLYQEGDDDFILASVAKHSTNINSNVSWKEIQADGIYVIDTQLQKCYREIKCHFWKSITNPHCLKVDVMKQYDTGYTNKIMDSNGSAKNDHIAIDLNIETFNSSFEKVVKSQIVDKMSDLDALVAICESQNVWPLVDLFTNVLKKSVQRRVSNLPKYSNSHSSISILFSGGIDCSVLALLANEYVPISEPINLLNVAFETLKNKNFDVPDRSTGRMSYEELSKLCPNRVWNFVEINIELDELRETRIKRIADLTYPLTTVLDDSIGCALWFAAYGGTIHPECKPKVVLCGMGADEQLGGYSRHRSAFENRGWEGLGNEIMMELERISSRNLGRDNRIIADHGTEARFPYLDENVISFLNKIPLSSKTNLNYKRGLGEKLLLRATAYNLGLRNVAVFPKRAIQFGSRIAKAECNKEKASDICSRLL
uniref:asparagine synthetase domain-containing protein 1-like n=1 Tax=Styela clava TaxID=7725 RepID=UPI0019396CC2|nr:asparagine synthetase domain-containing protein 1-like [Styela clava]